VFFEIMRCSCIQKSDLNSSHEKSVVALTLNGMMMFAAGRAAAFQDLIMNPDFRGSRFMYFRPVDGEAK
jgi:hypothetical protein